MTIKHSIRRYRHWYAKLLRLYSKPYYERFGESMEQTFSDLLHERRDVQRGLFAFVLWIFVKTSAGIFRERITMHNKNIIRIALVTAFILLLPLVALQFTDEVVWGPFDFAVAGALLFGTGLTYELVAKRMSTIAYRVAVGVALATAFILVWANLAVGIIGSENECANLMYIGVLAIGLIGALIARFQPRGMARALFATALVQALVTVIALIAGMHRYPGSSVTEIVNLNLFFVALWVGSALLFQRASSADSNVPRQHLMDKKAG